MAVDHTVAVVIPTKDRPVLLEEAILSARRQSHPPAEIIVVDDGSATPVDASALAARHGSTVRVLRNERSEGLAFSRNRGVEACHSRYVTHLDDDDLLAPEAIERCLQATLEHPRVEIWFFAVQGFGERSEHFNRVQAEGVRRVCEAGGRQPGRGVVVFDRELFPLLLRGVPIAFQRVFTTAAKWTEVSRLRWRCYMLNPEVPDETAARHALPGTLRDSEWARYAAATCALTGLVEQALYHQRCSGQGYSSQTANLEIHGRQGMLILEQLAVGARRLPELKAWRRDIEDALRTAHFDAAYMRQQKGELALAWKNLGRSAAKGLEARHLRLATRLLMTRSKAPSAADS